MTFDTWQKNLVDASGIKGDGTLLGTPTWQKALANISSGMKLVHSETIDYNTTNTSVVLIKTITLEKDLWDANKMLVMVVTDTAGIRAGYFLGSVSIIPNYGAYNGVSSVGTFPYGIYKGGSTGAVSAYMGSTKYGIFPNSFNNDGELGIYGRYNSSNTGTINGKYKIEIFVVDLPEGTLFPKKSD